MFYLDFYFSWPGEEKKLCAIEKIGPTQRGGLEKAVHDPQ